MYIGKMFNINTVSHFNEAHKEIYVDFANQLPPQLPSPHAPAHVGFICY